MAYAGTIGEKRIYHSIAPAHQGYDVLHAAFTVIPLVAGLDKFLNILTNWTQYLNPIFPQTLGISAQYFMYGVGVVEIVAAILVAVRPRVGGYIVMLWMWGVIANLLSQGAFYDIALRDFGLSLAALALARLSVSFERPVVEPL